MKKKAVVGLIARQALKRPFLALSAGMFPADVKESLTKAKAFSKKHFNAATFEGMPVTASLQKKAAKDSAAITLIRHGLLGALGAGVGAVAIGGIVHGLSKTRTMFEAERSWKEVLRTNPELRNNQKAKDNFNLLAKFGPSLATSPILAADIIKRNLQFEITPVEFIKQIVDIERNRMSPFTEFASQTGGEGLKAGLKSGFGVAYPERRPRRN